MLHLKEFNIYESVKHIMTMNSFNEYIQRMTTLLQRLSECFDFLWEDEHYGVL